MLPGVRRLLSVTLLLSGISAFGQEFEGFVRYEITVESDDEFFRNLLIKGLGTEKTFYYKDGIYKTIVNGTTLFESTFKPRENKLYKYLPDKNAYKVIDCGIDKNNGAVLEQTVSESNETILGYRCQKLFIRLDLQEITYYFSDRTAIEPKHFSNHKHEYWDIITKHAKSIPLKIVSAMGDGSVVTFTAIEINKDPLSDDFFKLKSDATLLEK